MDDLFGHEIDGHGQKYTLPVFANSSDEEISEDAMQKVKHILSVAIAHGFSASHTHVPIVTSRSYVQYFFVSWSSFARFARAYSTRSTGMHIN